MLLWLVLGKIAEGIANAVVATAAAAAKKQRIITDQSLSQRTQAL